jgi:hypothetical protein
MKTTLQIAYKDTADTTAHCQNCQVEIKEGDTFYFNDDFDTCSEKCLVDLINMPCEPYPRTNAMIEW